MLDHLRTGDVVTIDPPDKLSQRCPQGWSRIDAEVRFDSLVKSWSGPVQAGFVSKHRFIDHQDGTKDVLHETWEVTALRAATGDEQERGEDAGE